MSSSSGEHDRDEDREVGEAFGAYLAGELDPQLGRARRAFERHVMRPAPAPARRVRASGWMIGAIGTALAASVAALWAVPVLRQQTGTSTTTTISEPTLTGSTSGQHVVMDSLPAASTKGGWQRTSHEVSSAFIPSETLIVEGIAPARVVRQVEVERTQWVDERHGVRVEAVTPRESVRLIALDTY